MAELIDILLPHRELEGNTHQFGQWLNTTFQH